MTEAEWMLHQLNLYESGADLIGLQRLRAAVEDKVDRERRETLANMTVARA